jgi:hypothetical protein
MDDAVKAVMGGTTPAPCYQLSIPVKTTDKADKVLQIQ